MAPAGLPRCLWVQGEMCGRGGCSGMMRRAASSMAVVEGGGGWANGSSTLSAEGIVGLEYRGRIEDVAVALGVVAAGVDTLWSAMRLVTKLCRWRGRIEWKWCSCRRTFRHRCVTPSLCCSLQIRNHHLTFCLRGRVKPPALFVAQSQQMPQHFLTSGWKCVLDSALMGLSFVHVLFRNRCEYVLMGILDSSMYACAAIEETESRISSFHSLVYNACRASFYHMLFARVRSSDRRPAGKSAAIGPQAKGGQDTQKDGKRLARLDSTWNGASCENNRRQQSEFYTIGVSVVDAQAAEYVLLQRQLLPWE